MKPSLSIRQGLSSQHKPKKSNQHPTSTQKTLSATPNIKISSYSIATITKIMTMI
jgi:hypothetical protein